MTEGRTDPTLYPVVLAPTARYSDLDPSRRVGRDAVIRWFEDARVAVERGLVGQTIDNRQLSGHYGQLLAAIGVELHAPLRIGRDYRVGIGVSHLGRSSFSYDYGVFAGPDLVASGRSTSVFVKDLQITPLPDDLRAGLEAIRVADREVVKPVLDEAGLVRENYPFRYDVRTRFGDIDTNRHVNNVVLASWYLDGIAELHTDVLGYPLGGPMVGFAPSSLSVQYLEQVHYPGIYQLRVGVAELGDAEIRYALGLFDGSRCLGLAKASGPVSAVAEDGSVVDLAEKFAAFRLRG